MAAALDSQAPDLSNYAQLYSLEYIYINVLPLSLFLYLFPPRPVRMPKHILELSKCVPDPFYAFAVAAALLPVTLRLIKATPRFCS